MKPSCLIIAISMLRYVPFLHQIYTQELRKVEYKLYLRILRKKELIYKR